jgi:hypothetical protein
MRYLWILILCSTGFTQCLGDMNEDGIKDILDIVNLVNDILDGDDVCEEPEPSLCDGTEVELWGQSYVIESTTSIELWGQGLTGSIPPEIGCLTNLTYLYLGGNQLTGEIPPEIGNLTNLTELWLHTNLLTGEIPPEVCELIESNNWPPWWNIEGYILNGNNLINTCEEEVDICDGLTEVELRGVWYDIESTTFIWGDWEPVGGTIPPEIGCLTNLTSLELQGNHIAGEIPPEIGNLTNLTYFSLYNNHLSGEIPPEIGNLTNLTYLRLSDNQLTGEIPSEVCALIESNNLNMDNILGCEAGALYCNNLINTCE